MTDDNKKLRSIPIELVTSRTKYNTKRYCELLCKTVNSITEPFGLECVKNYDIDIKFIQEFSQTKISIMVVDKKSSIVVEVKDDDALNSLDAQSTYSTRVLTVLSYVSIFESYWALSQMYEESINELASTKEYLDKVLTEIDDNKTR
jgi:hypothetical protein